MNGAMGTGWTKAELERIADLTAKHDRAVVALGNPVLSGTWNDLRRLIARLLVWEAEQLK